MLAPPGGEEREERQEGQRASGGGKEGGGELDTWEGGREDELAFGGVEPVLS